MPHDASDLRPDRSRRVAIIGAGPGGICTAVRLLERGHDDFVILEKAPGIGGTWWHNRYPGAECDIKSHLYSFSFAPNPTGRARYARQPEIKAYLEECVDRFGLGPHLRLGTDGPRRRAGTTTDAVWRLTVGDDARSSRPTSWSARSGCSASRSLPDIPGLDRFAGTIVPLRALGRRPRPHRRSGSAVIGSARQRGAARPRDRAGRRAAHLYQRSANWVLPKEDDPYTDGAARARSGADPTRSPRCASAIFATVDPNLDLRRPGAARRWPRPAGLHNIEVVEDPRGAAAAHARPCRSGASGRWLERLLPDVQPAQRRARHRADHARSRARGSSPPTAARARSTPSSSPPASRPPSSSPRSTSSGRGGRAHRRRVGRRRPGVPRHHHQRASRTCSCSTGRTPTTARSST